MPIFCFFPDWPSGGLSLMDGSDEQRSVKNRGVARQQFLYSIAVKVIMILQSLILLETSFATFEKLFNPYLDEM